MKSVSASLNYDNYMVINLDLIQLMGLTTAGYLTELITIKNKAVRKNKTKEIENIIYFKVDREYIKQKLGISEEEQTKIEKKLAEINVIKFIINNGLIVPNIISLNEDLLCGLLYMSDDKMFNDVKLRCAKTVKGILPTKNELIKENMKKFVKCEKELEPLYFNWIESVYARPTNNFLTKAIINNFQNEINNYTNSIEVKRDLLSIAITRGYKDFKYIKSIYETEMKNFKPFQTSTLNVMKNVTY